MPRGDTASLERALERLSETLERLNSNVESGARGGALAGSGGRTNVPTGAGGRGGRSPATGQLPIGNLGGVALSQAVRFGSAGVKAGFSSFVASRGSIGFEGAVSNGTAAALRLIPGGSALVDRRQGPGVRAVQRARGIIEPILRGGGLQGKGEARNAFNRLVSRFRAQEKRAQGGIDIGLELQEKEKSRAGSVIAKDLKKVGEKMGEGFLEFIRKNPQKLIHPALPNFGVEIPKFGGKK